jgi:hypothetical protein
MPERPLRRPGISSSGKPDVPTLRQSQRLSLAKSLASSHPLRGTPVHALTWVDAFLMCHCHWRRRRALRLTTTRWKQCRKRPSSAKTADCRVWRARLAPGAQVGVGDGARKAAEPPLVHDVGARERNSKPIPAIEGDLFTPSHSRSLTVAREVGVSLCIESIKGASVVFGEGEIILNSGG